MWTYQGVVLAPWAAVCVLVDVTFVSNKVTTIKWAFLACIGTLGQVVTVLSPWQLGATAILAGDDFRVC